MLDSDRRYYAEQTMERFGQFLKDLDAVIARLKDMRGGYPSGGLNGSRGARESTQPERGADQSDKAVNDLRRIDRLVEQVYERTTELNNIRASTMPRRGVAAQGERGCRSCVRVGKTSLVYRGDRCRWCYDRSLELQRDPPVKAVEWYSQGRRVTERMMRDAITDEALAKAEMASKNRRGHHRIRRG